MSFRRFAGLGLEEGIPDHTVLNRFRNLLIAESLLEKLFAELDRQLEKAGMMLKRGTMLDATLIETVARPPSDERASVDGDARFGGPRGKGGSTFGYKAHVGVDEGSGLIRSLITTPANVNETVVADRLLRGDERFVLADAAYDTHARRARLKAEGVKPRIARRPNKHHPKLPVRLERYNRLVGVAPRWTTLAQAAHGSRQSAPASVLRRWRDRHTQLRNKCGEGQNYGMDPSFRWGDHVSNGARNTARTGEASRLAKRKGSAISS